MIKGDIVHGCVFLILFCKLYLDRLGDLLGEGAFGSVRKAVHEITRKEYAIKISSLETEERRKVADAEKDSLEHLKGFSQYLVDLIECFDVVCYFLQNKILFMDVSV
jgi:serine/threonine protein kinase